MGRKEDKWFQSRNPFNSNTSHKSKVHTYILTLYSIIKNAIVIDSRGKLKMRNSCISFNYIYSHSLVLNLSKPIKREMGENPIHHDPEFWEAEKKWRSVFVYFSFAWFKSATTKSEKFLFKIEASTKTPDCYSHFWFCLCYGNQFTIWKRSYLQVKIFGVLSICYGLNPKLPPKDSGIKNLVPNAVMFRVGPREATGSGRC